MLMMKLVIQVNDLMEEWRLARPNKDMDEFIVETLKDINKKVYELLEGLEEDRQQLEYNQATEEMMEFKTFAEYRRLKFRFHDSMQAIHDAVHKQDGSAVKSRGIRQEALETGIKKA